ncbi:metallophosphoesterase [Kineococcus gynurae]|uniref:Metallophosphoesterase n=1 Tax=Kineococcus gynurae TaxID=452979 RepID=A0ABV5LU31_9ACTN
MPASASSLGRSLLTATALTGAAGLAGVGYASLYERNAFRLRHAIVPVLPVGQAPIRVLHVSDLHLLPGQRRKIDFLQGLAQLEPDLVVDTGDNLAGVDAIPAALDAFAPLLELPGVFVLGSNDYWAPQPRNWFKYLTRRKPNKKITAPRLATEELVEGFTRAGWTDLDNARSRLEVAGRTIEFVGVDDPHLHYDRYAEVQAPAATDVDLTIAVAHAPYRRTLDAFVADGAPLVIAGHTHGGQLCVPFYGALVTNCDLPAKQAKGLSRWSAGGNDAWLHVSAGLGTSPYAPLRFACHPEATLLELVARR